MSGKQGEARSLVGIAFEAYVKAHKAQQRADAATVEVKRWLKTLNAAEREEYETQVASFNDAQDA